MHSDDYDGELAVTLLYREHGHWQRVPFSALEPALWTLAEWRADGVDACIVITPKGCANTLTDSMPLALAEA